MTYNQIRKENLERKNRRKIMRRLIGELNSPLSNYNPHYNRKANEALLCNFMDNPHNSKFFKITIP